MRLGSLLPGVKYFDSHFLKAGDAIQFDQTRNMFHSMVASAFICSHTISDQGISCFPCLSVPIDQSRVESSRTFIFGPLVSLPADHRIPMALSLPGPLFLCLIIVCESSILNQSSSDAKCKTLLPALLQPPSHSFSIHPHCAPHSLSLLLTRLCCIHHQPCSCQGFPFLLHFSSILLP